MAIKHDVIDVRVSEQSLWVGTGEYPLKGISRVGSGVWEPGRGLLVRRFLGSVAGWWLAGLLVASALALLRPGQDGPPALVVLGLVTVTATKAVRLASWLRCTFHKLDVETAGLAKTVLVSKDAAVVHDLVALITTAVGDPDAEFHLKVDNFSLGDSSPSAEPTAV
ncbi:DUF6232 family protein [Lentzea sp. NPDC059081]|uniref:DUF6232 family protein n=1 Tax=Lentzea sp. NPDC059081 TaxID=3346719 RepID=UPI0036BC7996